MGIIDSVRHKFAGNFSSDLPWEKGESILTFVERNIDVVTGKLDVNAGNHP